MVNPAETIRTNVWRMATVQMNRIGTDLRCVRLCPTMTRCGFWNRNARSSESNGCLRRYRPDRTLLYEYLLLLLLTPSDNHQRLLPQLTGGYTMITTILSVIRNTTPTITTLNHPQEENEPILLEFQKPWLDPSSTITTTPVLLLRLL